MLLSWREITAKTQCHGWINKTWLQCQGEYCTNKMQSQSPVLSLAVRRPVTTCLIFQGTCKEVNLCLRLKNNVMWATYSCNRASILCFLKDLYTANHDLKATHTFKFLSKYKRYTKNGSYLFWAKVGPSSVNYTLDLSALWNKLLIAIHFSCALDNDKCACCI